MMQNDLKKYPQDDARHFLSVKPTRSEIGQFMQALQQEFAATKDKKVFFTKYKLIFNCYAWAAGGVGNPFDMDGHDRPELSTAVPGAAAGKPMRLVTPEEIRRGVVADGFTPAIPPEREKALLPLQRMQMNEAIAKEVRPGYTLVAAFIDDRGVHQEPHFAVRDDRLAWSQKFGCGEIEEWDYNGIDRIRAPHEGRNSFQNLSRNNQEGYRFIGYYWRPSAGLNVAGGIAAAVGIPAADGKGVRQDVWLSSKDGDLHVTKEVRGWSLNKNADGSITVGLQHAANVQTFVTLPKASIITLDEPKNGGNVDYVSIVDPSGPAIQLKLLPNGKVKSTRLDNPEIKRPSPFRE